MSLTNGRGAEDLYAIAVVVLLGAVLALSAGASRPGAMGWLLTAVVFAGWSWAMLKEGFVRHDTHDLTFFGLMAVAVAIPGLKRAYLPAQGGALCAALVFYCLAGGGVPEQLHSPGASTVAFGRDVGAVAGLGGFSSAQAQLRDQLVAGGSLLPPTALALVEGHSVAIEPTDAAIAYVYQQLGWDPLPVLQGYTAYSTYLDDLDASLLTSPRGPQRLVYQPLATIDERDPWWDPPAAVESMLCHYVQLSTYGTGEGRTEVLARSPGSGERCGEPDFLSKVEAHFGERVAVPEVRGEMVTASFSLHLPFSSEARGILLKAPNLYVTTWPPGRGKPVADPTKYRFVPGTARDAHVVSVPSDLGYSLPFTPPAIGSLALSGGGWPNGEGVYSVTFYALAIRSLSTVTGRS